MLEMTATSLRESGITDCPVLDPAVQQRFRGIVHDASDYSLQVRDWLDAKQPSEQAAWLKTSLAAGRDLFQPWAMEILYAIAVLETARFSQLEALLGLSSKTLAAKLRSLQESGFAERIVHDETPVRIEYRLTKAGRATAALASPLFTYFNFMRAGALQSL